MIFLYRKNGGQVIGASVDATVYATADPTYFGLATNPPTPDGTSLVGKIWDGTSVRTATAPEVAQFAVSQTGDELLQARAAAISLLRDNPHLRKVLQALVGLVVTQLNIVRQQPSTVFAAITNAQAVTAIINSITAGQFD